MAHITPPSAPPSGPPIDGKVATTGSLAYGAGVTGEANDRVIIRGGGTIELGAGGASATDTTITRTSPQVIAIGTVGGSANGGVLDVTNGQVFAYNVNVGNLLQNAAGTGFISFSAVAGQVSVVTGGLRVATIGQGLRVAEGANAKQGTAVLAAGTVTVANTSVTANSRIFLTTNAPGGTVGTPYVSARTAGTSFVITSTSATDTSTVAYQIFEPA